MCREKNILFGRLTKTHGYRGHLVLKADPEATMVEKEPESVFLKIDGIQVPFFIEEFSERNLPLYTLKLEGVDDHNSALKLVDTLIYIDREFVEEKADDQSGLKNLIGFSVKDQDDRILGTITALMDIPGNPLFSVEHEGNEFLLPVNEDLILEIAVDEKSIVMEVREGLTNL